MQGIAKFQLLVRLFLGLAFAVSCSGIAMAEPKSEGDYQDSNVQTVEFSKAVFLPGFISPSNKFISAGRYSILNSALYLVEKAAPSKITPVFNKPGKNRMVIAAYSSDFEESGVKRDLPEGFVPFSLGYRGLTTFMRGPDEVVFVRFNFDEFFATGDLATIDSTKSSLELASTDSEGFVKLVAALAGEIYGNANRILFPSRDWTLLAYGKVSPEKTKRILLQNSLIASVESARFLDRLITQNFSFSSELKEALSKGLRIELSRVTRLRAELEVLQLQANPSPIASLYRNQQLRPHEGAGIDGNSEPLKPTGLGRSRACVTLVASTRLE